MLVNCQASSRSWHNWSLISKPASLNWNVPVWFDSLLWEISFLTETPLNSGRKDLLSFLQVYVCSACAAALNLFAHELIFENNLLLNLFAVKLICDSPLHELSYFETSEI